MARAIDIVQVKREIQSGKLAVELKNNDVLLTDKQSEEAVCIATLTPPNEPECAGLYGKYTVYKNKDGSLVTDCFILRPTKDPAAVAALRAYAAATDNAELAADIINWVGAAPNESLTIEQLREMDGEPVWIVDVGPHKWYGPGWAIVDRDNCLVRTTKNWNPINRLAAIEDILGDEYDLDELSKAMAALRREQP